MSLPSGNGQADAAHSTSVVFASDAPPINATIDETTLATWVKQDTGNTSLASLDTKTPGKGAATVANSRPVSLATDHPALPLPTGASTAAAQTTGNASLSSIDSKLTAIAPTGPGAGSATPSASRLFRITVGAATAVSVNIGSDANFAGLLAAIVAGKLLTIKANVDMLYNWATAAITIAATSTAAVTPATQGMPIFAGERADERAGAGTATTFLNILGGTAAGTFSVAIAEP